MKRLAMIVIFAGCLHAQTRTVITDGGGGGYLAIVNSSGYLETLIENSSIAVTGTFWQATQPVSGTFWQATQPVSGTFWQATQPVSGTVTANAGTNLNTSALALESGGNLAALAADPCIQVARSVYIINLTGSAKVISGTSAKQTYICFIQFALSATADNVALVEGTGSTCGTNTAGMAGGATAATGWNLLASGSVTAGTMVSWAFETATLADDVCLLASSGAQISGIAQYVQK